LVGKSLHGLEGEGHGGRWAGRSAITIQTDFRARG
jgi:hypothetical protein